MRSFLFLAAVAAPLSAQTVPSKTLSKPDVEYSEPFTSLNSIRELRDGRVIVSDLRDKTLQAIDLATKRAVSIGREGSGPTEWGLPTRLLPMPGDSTYVTDLLNSRFLVVGPDAKPVKTFSPAADAALRGTAVDGGRGGAGAGGGAAGGGRAAGGRGGLVVAGGGLGAGSILTARWSDARGRLYFTGSPFTFSADGVPSQADSVPILRQSPGATVIDTVAYIRMAPGSASATSTSRGGNTAQNFRIGGGRPFESGDEWVVFPDGRVAIARVADYHIDVVQANKQVVRGTPVRYTPVRVTEADKEQWRESRRNATMVAVTQTVGGAGAAPQRSVQSGALPPAQEPAEWPEVKSPFPAQSVWPAPNGDTWVFRSRAANDRVPAADVFNARGQLIGRMLLPEGTRVVGLGAKGVYATRSDADDLQYLQRFAVVWESCTPELAENCRR